MLALAISEALIFINTDLDGINVVISLIFINSLYFTVSHVILTWLMLINIPEFVSWYRTQKNGPVNKFGIELVIIFSVSTVFFLIVGFNLGLQFLLVKILVLLLFQKQHVIYQTYGLSKNYNFHLSQIADKTMTDDIRRSEALERFGFFIFYIFTVLASFIFTLREELHSNFIAVNYSSIRSTIWICMMIGLFLIFYGAFKFPGQKNSNKIAHLIKLLHFPLSNFSLIASAACNINHTIEYFFVYTRNINNSNMMTTKKISLVLTGAIVLFSIGILFSYYVYYEEISRIKFSGYGDGFIIFNAVIYGVGFTHYYMDSRLFKMKDPQIRKFIGPLVVN